MRLKHKFRYLDGHINFFQHYKEKVTKAVRNLAELLFSPREEIIDDGLSLDGSNVEVVICEALLSVCIAGKDYFSKYTNYL